MGKLLWFEVKRSLKQSKTWILIILIFLLSLIMIQNYKTELAKYSFNNKGRSGELIQNSAKTFQAYLKDKGQFDGYDRVMDSTKIMSDLGAQLNLASRNNDYETIFRLRSFYYLIYAKDIAQTEGELKEEAYKSAVMDIWNQVSGGIEYEKVSFQPVGYGGKRGDYHSLLLHANYYFDLYQKHLVLPDYDCSYDGALFIYHYLNKVIPIILSFIVLILMFDSVNSEIYHGSMKLVLTQPISRSKYVIAKSIAGVLHTWFIILIPIIIITIGNCLKGSLNTFRYPVLYLKKGFLEFDPLPTYLEVDKKTYGHYFHIGISSYSGIPKGEYTISNRIELIPLYQFIMLAMILTTLSILFLVVFNVFLSTIIKSKTIGFIISAVITGAGTFAGNYFLQGERHNLNPFSMNNSVRILSGTYNVTPLAAAGILTISFFVLFIINLRYFKTKDL